MDLAKDNWWKIAITIFIFTLYIIGANTDPNSISTPIENSEWDGSLSVLSSIVVVSVVLLILESNLASLRVYS